MVARETGSRWSRRRRVALVAALGILLALAALWLLRKPIASRYVDRTLAAANVPASYTVADLGLGAQRLTNVVIGDPARPDLVADWIETRTRIGARGPELAGVRAGRLRVRGRLVDGRLSLGAIDRLLPKGDGGPFSLPKLDLDVEDARMRLETPYGLAGVALRGSGRLDGGFKGRVAMVSERLGASDCAAERVAAVMQLRTGKMLLFDGPLRAARASCGNVSVANWRNEVKASVPADGGRGASVRVQTATGPVAHRLGKRAR